jgi:hypothetical protein
MPARDNTVVVEGARIIFRNFAGKEGQFNREGDRNFAVVLDPEMAATLDADGWNVKQFNPRDDDEEGVEPGFYLPVSVKFDIRPPRVVLITSRGRSNMDERSIEMLDWADIINVDMIVSPYHWNVNGKTGIKAYLQSLYVTIEEDALERKYAELDQA